VAKRILIIEDEKALASLLSDYLAVDGFSVDARFDGPSGLQAALTGAFDLVLLDLMLPGLDGFEVCRALREQSDVPVLILSARREDGDKIRGLGLGADDYVVKPFSPQELVSRVRAVLRRAGRDQDPSPGERLLTFGGLIIDSTARTVTATGREVSLTLKEFDLLYWLARHPRQVFTRDQLLDRIWGGREYIDPGTVTVHVRRLREKIEPDPSHPSHLQTVWGMGYKFEP